MGGNQIKRFVDDFPSPQPLYVVVGGVYPSRSGFRYAPAREATIFDRPPLNPLPFGGEEVSALQ